MRIRRARPLAGSTAPSCCAASRRRLPPPWSITLRPAAPRASCSKGVVEDRAHGVFLGRIAVRPEAQKADAQQTNRNLLLSRRAAVDTKPELEISPTT